MWKAFEIKPGKSSTQRIWHINNELPPYHFHLPLIFDLPLKLNLSTHSHKKKQKDKKENHISFFIKLNKSWGGFTFHTYTFARLLLCPLYWTTNTQTHTHTKNAFRQKSSESNYYRFEAAREYWNDIKLHWHIH